VKVKGFWRQWVSGEEQGLSQQGEKTKDKRAKKATPEKKGSKGLHGNVPSN